MDTQPLDYALPRLKRPASAWTAVLIAANLLVLAGIALPLADDVFNLGRHGTTRCGSKLLQCSSNLRQIGLAIKMYANESKGAFPPTLGDVLIAEEITSGVFVCPSSAQTRALGPTTQSTAALVNRSGGNHCSYIYVGDGLNERTTQPDDVIAFEPISNHGGPFNVLFADCSDEHYDARPGGPDIVLYQHLMADFAAGIRPLRLRP